jgi:hypothetical protein
MAAVLNLFKNIKTTSRRISPNTGPGIRISKNFLIASPKSWKKKIINIARSIFLIF